MAIVRCPRCGTINPNGRRRLARCRRCHEELAGCRYCTYYDPRLMDCTHPARPDWLRIVDARESLNCADFTSMLTGGPARRQLLRVIRTGSMAGLGVMAHLR